MDLKWGIIDIQVVSKSWTQFEIQSNLKLSPSSLNTLYSKNRTIKQGSGEVHYTDM